MKYIVHNFVKSSLSALLLLTPIITNASDSVENTKENDVDFTLGAPTTQLDLNAVSEVDKLLDVSPELMDEYIQLQRDIKMLTAVLLLKTGNSSEEFQKFNEYQKLISNKYNPNEIFNLFRQLDVQSHQKDITDNEYDLSRLKLKLYTAQVRYREIETLVEQTYFKKYAVDDDALIQRLLNHQPLLITVTQKPLVLNLLRSFENSPTVFSEILSHPSVVALLPDYLKEQLNIFKEANISLVEALHKPDVMKAVINKVNAINFTTAELDDDLTNSIYSQQQVPKVLDSIVMPIYISSDLDADTVNPIEAIQLYDIPLPSQALVLLLASIRDDNDTSVYSSLSDYSLDKIVDWQGLDITYSVATQSSYLTSLDNVHGPGTADLTQTLPDSLSASFSGEMAGEFSDGSGSLTGDINLEVSFAGNSETLIEGDFTLNSSLDDINGVIPSTQISSPTNFELNFTTDSDQQGGLNGSFFGTDADEVGGVWALSNNSNGLNGAIGRFRAKR